MGQHAALGRDLIPHSNGIDEPQQRNNRFNAIGDRIDADDGVAAFQHQAVNDAGSDTPRIVGWVIGLETRRETSWEANGGAELRDHANLGSHRDQVLQAHDLGYGGGHLGH